MVDNFILSHFGILKPRKRPTKRKSISEPKPPLKQILSPESKKKNLESKNKKREKHKLKAIAYLGGVCRDCGQMPHIAAMDFHHLESKKYNIGTILTRPWFHIQPELDKCILLCSNCHRALHYKENRN